MNESDVLLQLHGVHKRYGDFVALHSVDVGIRQGEFFTILGPSGCGKSTLLRLIGGFEQPTSGSIDLDGKKIGSLPPERRPFNTVFQSYALFPHMTVWDNVAYGLRVAGVGRSDVVRRVGEALRMVDMESFAERRPPTMSGGQRQRVALARALVNEPSVLLLDEPLGALDLKLRHSLQTQLRAIQHRLGIAFVFVTHDQEEAMSLSDRICVMRAGAIEQLGTPRDLYQRPQSAYVADFIGHANLLHCRLTGASGAGFEARFGFGGGAVMPTYAPEILRVGDEVLAVVRPEELEIVGTDLVDDRAFSGRVVDTVFLGADVHYTVELADGTTIDVRGRDGVAVGPEGLVRVRIRKECGVLVPADDEIAPARRYSDLPEIEAIAG